MPSSEAAIPGPDLAQQEELSCVLGASVPRALAPHPSNQA